jgi:hypothetical protein
VTVSESRSFTLVCEELQRRTALDRLEARGTVRIALKQAGLDPGAVTPREMSVVLEKILPEQLRSRGVASPESVCREFGGSLSALPKEEQGETPDRIFARLAGNTNRS